MARDINYEFELNQAKEIEQGLLIFKVGTGLTICTSISNMHHTSIFDQILILFPFLFQVRQTFYLIGIQE